MFFRPKAVVEAIQSVADRIEQLTEALHALDTGGSTDGLLEARVSAIETGVSRQLGEAEVLMLKAKGKFDAARAAEERGRRLLDSAERASEVPEDGEDLEAIVRAYEDAGIPIGNGAGGEPEEVPALSPYLGSTALGKSAAHAMKMGRR